MNFKELLEDCNKEPEETNYLYVASKGIAHIYPRYTKNPKQGDEEHTGFVLSVDSEVEAKRVADAIKRFEDHAYGNAITNVASKLITLLNDVLQYTPGIKRK